MCDDMSYHDFNRFLYEVCVQELGAPAKLLDIIDTHYVRVVSEDLVYSAPEIMKNTELKYKKGLADKVVEWLDESCGKHKALAAQLSAAFQL